MISFLSLKKNPENTMKYQSVHKAPYSDLLDFRPKQPDFLCPLMN